MYFNSESTAGNVVKTPNFCFYCPDIKPLLNAKSLAIATFFSVSVVAYHKSCIKKCHVNSDGTVHDCCGNVSEDDSLDEDSFHGFTTNNNTTKSNQNHSGYSSKKDLTNNQLRNILMGSLDKISDDLANTMIK